MPDSRITALARLLTEYSMRVEAGQLVTIGGTPLADPLIRAVYQQVLERGAHPALQVSLPGTSEIFYRFANDEQLSFINPDERIFTEQADAALRILSDANTKALSGVDPARQQIAQRARADLRRTYLQRAAEGALAWCVTLFPTNALAQDAEMSLADYEDFVYSAGLLDSDDPVAAWRAVSREQQRLCDWLAAKHEIHVTAPDTDLRLSISGRTFINADGRYNFPDGEIFTGPVEDSVNGHVRFSFPSTTGGRRVEDIRLWFEHGKVVKGTAGTNEEFLHRMLEADEGARRLGEFALGTNRNIQRFSGNTLFDEKIGGTLHVAIGSGYPETGSQNQSAVHWDMICDLRQESEIRVDGQLFMKNGQFAV